MSNCKLPHLHSGPCDYSPTPAPNREAELKVIEAAKEVLKQNEPNSPHWCPKLQGNLYRLQQALASLAQSEMKA